MSCHSRISTDGSEKKGSKLQRIASLLYISLWTIFPYNNSFMVHLTRAMKLMQSPEKTGVESLCFTIILKNSIHSSILSFILRRRAFQRWEASRLSDDWTCLIFWWNIWPMEKFVFGDHWAYFESFYYAQAMKNSQLLDNSRRHLTSSYFTTHVVELNIFP